METKVIDFKQPLESQLGKINKNQEPKTKDFSNTLNSVTKNTETTTKDSSKVSKEVKTTEKEVEEVVEELEKEDKVLYENMINVLNLRMPIESDSVVNLEEIEVNLDEFLTSTVILDKNLELNSEVVSDEEMINLINLVEEDEGLKKVIKEDSRELISKNQVSSEDEKFKSNNTLDKVISTEIQPETKSLDESSVENEEVTQINVENVISKKTTNEFDDTNQEDMTKSESKYELVSSTDTENDLKVKNESFGPFIKEGIEFSSEQPIEADTPIIGPKEVVKQIVEQVKFDLSESKNEMKLTLKPESLGEMTMNVEVAKDGIIAKIMVDNYRTKEIIEGNLVQLKEGIKDTGMEIKTFEVFVGSGSDFDQHSFNQDNQFNLKQNSKKLRIKPENNKGVKGYEDGVVENKTKPLNYTLEGGINLFA